MRKVKGYQRRDVGVLREQSGRLPVTSNDSQFTMFTKRERAHRRPTLPRIRAVVSRRR